MSRMMIPCLAAALMMHQALAVPQGDVAGERVEASDVSLTQVSSNWRWERAASGLSGELSLARNAFEVDYAPVAFDFRGEAREVSDHSEALQARVVWRSGETWEWIGTAGLYQGFTNYRSLWLAEYFRQQFEPLGQTAIDRWVEPDPRGGSVGGGWRWEYLRASGFLELTASVSRDEVAPGYEIDFEGLRRGRDELNGTSVTVSTENILSPRLRSRVELRASRVSEREWRVGGEAALNWAVGERFVLRGLWGGTTEDPQFRSWHAALTGDWSIDDHWAVYLQGRAYEDTGEIEDALLFTSAAPGLSSRQWALGVRWRGERWSLRMQAGELHSDHEPTNPRLDFFQNLYRDRTWSVLQVAGTFTF